MVLAVIEDEVLQAVLPFPAGSSDRPDGMRPQYLKDMLLCYDSGTDFLAARTGFTRVILASLCPHGQCHQGCEGDNVPLTFAACTPQGVQQNSKFDFIF